MPSPRKSVLTPPRVPRKEGPLLPPSLPLAIDRVGCRKCDWMGADGALYLLPQVLNQSSESFLLAVMGLSPFFQLAGQPLPLFAAANWADSRSRRVSSTDRPMGSSCTDIERIMPAGSMIKVARIVTPWCSSSSSSTSTPKLRAISLLRSERRGYLMLPTPPSSRAVRVQARCVCFESTLTPITSAPRALKSLRRLSNSTISVGQTKVKSRG
mmetsp:Transcript_6718/g.17176  ORF Transcript_6718/g.17176 Transcript_6718/m.17176 type:complete len:212 (-) Transcript_6718:1017-1652(-)